jgi:hypothetical protein
MTTFTTEDRLKATEPERPPKRGSIWGSADMIKFRVIEIVYADDNVWVHYLRLTDNKEFSCFVDSFVSRFRELPE